MRLGARIFKTGIAIILAMSIASLLPDNIGLKTLAGVSAVVAMQPSVYRSIKTVSEQAIGNVIGALLAVTMVTIFSNNFIIMGVTVILLIAILFQFNLAHVATLASVTALIIMGQHTGSFYVAAFFRFVLVMIGVLSSSVVNLIFLPPKFETKIYYNSMNISSDIFVWFKLVLNDTSEFHNIKQDGDQLNSRINKLEKIFDYYNEERPLTKKHIYQQNRKKILFREVVRTTRHAYEVLKRMSRYQNDLYQLNNQLLLQIKLELDSLVTLHEQIFKSLSKKARYDVTQLDYEVDNPQKKNLMDAFQQELIKNPHQTKYSYSNMMQIIAEIEEYRYQLEHLDRIRLSFFTYHRSDTDIDISDEDFDL
ncbi:FUSC family protein [Staphylococcus epidermidis]|uniref:FUSC family protein n=1 Tax=Staphylococcus epidermidis TaxID=1282 RepID=UPI0018884207|nr:aromatic acid exporter family protein [Staphylococcus epidermidis]MBF2273626.1 aromatic acid exporter family protein [Staphylococcus epidermidis]MBF2275806.1 aromatic acid exporter family protein [Staphylococcus epidermidis]MBF2277999.1 aromatic acid exporter family protein [Staphylococcus epidermidis]MBF2280295.1 aromatic acid exporter family protein [Staphylococcus epidermidis]